MEAHKTIGTVFKVLGISIIMMIIMDVSLMVIDTITVKNRIETLSIVMQDELSRNNAIPDDIATLFDTQLREVVNKSNIATDIEWNLNGPKTAKGQTYPAINEANVVDYGELMHLVIRVKMEPHSILFYKDTKQNGGGFLGTNKLKYVDEYVYPVPALRYLK